MTEQEAINLLCQMYLSYFSTEEKQALTTAIESLQKLSIYKQIKWERDVALDQLESIGVGLGRKMDDVKEAMEKQIPKKPILKDPLNYAIWTKKTGCCPICNSFVSALGNYHHCKYCGQAIDWSEEE